MELQVDTVTEELIRIFSTLVDLPLDAVVHLPSQVTPLILTLCKHKMFINIYFIYTFAYFILFNEFI